MAKAACLILGLSIAGCSSNNTSADGSRPGDGPGPVENTAALCSDGLDNDGDGFTDCADQDCWPLLLCETSRPDGSKPEDAAPGDGPLEASSPDGSKPEDAAPGDGPLEASSPTDGPAPEGALPDGPLADSGPGRDGAPGCSTHCDCEQGWRCAGGQCVQDPTGAVYCCGKPGCPPGHWCVSPAGAEGRCPEDPTFACQTACDCGPAHCCIDVPALAGKRCVKDAADPWLPGGVPIGGAQCSHGTDATYCCASFECQAGQLAYAGQPSAFRCYDGSSNQTATACEDKSCLGTACDCEPGEVCVDTTAKPAPPPGNTCHWGSGGTCVPSVAAAVVFGWPPAEILACCAAGCTTGSACDAGWQHLGNRFAYQRVVGTCGPCADGKHHSCGACGDGTCGPGEFPALCPADCSCGDGRCAPAEVGACVADCGTCGDGTCDPGEFATCADCDVCGDGWCSSAEVSTCAQDCWGVCQDMSTFPASFLVCGDGVCIAECLRDC